MAAAGADNPEKQELDPALMASSKVVVDSIEQCAAFGDLPGRTSDDEITIFDSTGAAIQDVASAVLVYKRALRMV